MNNSSDPGKSNSGPSGFRRSGIKKRFSAGFVFLVLALPAGCNPAQDLDKDRLVSAVEVPGGFPLSVDGHSVPLCLSRGEFTGVLKVAGLFRADIGRVTGNEPQIRYDDPTSLPERAVIIGTLGRSSLIDRMAEDGTLETGGIEGKWESYTIQVLDDPLQGVERAVVIAGSDKRGTIYGMFELSARMGVSPWYWWADVPVKRKESVYISPGMYTGGEPAVKYRGIFINDEAPALAGWVQENYGGFNAEFYEHVFELILRLKGNFLWPAMWGRAFYDDDPRNPQLADTYGIVIGTSHHEPMMRAHVEWSRYGEGPWNYEENETRLKEFWREGIVRMKDYESLVTIGMRGDGDEPMTEGTAIALLERIVSDQREIIEEETGKKPSEVPQVWALYKEVQVYYDKGMRVPDDVTLLLCDDNWGNIRKLPHPDSSNRPGGYGIYYHFDYVGGPRNYKWLNTNQIERTWEQMYRAWKHGVDKLWIVNVGDIKPMELPVQFFLDYAWDPDQWPAEKLPEYYVHWSTQQFGARRAHEIARILALYTKYNARRKPELLSPDTYSRVNYLEADRIVAEYKRILAAAEQINNDLPREYRDAYYQLVLFPVAACANLNELYVTAGKNRLYASQGRNMTNLLAERTRELFDKDVELTRYYHEEMANGKWNQMMSQTHIGYTYWQQPPANKMPEVETILIPDEASMDIAVEGSAVLQPDPGQKLQLGKFDNINKQSHYIEVFNKGKDAFEFSIRAAEDWILVSTTGGRVESQERLWISVDWDAVPEGKHTVPIEISGSEGSSFLLEAFIENHRDTEVPDGAHIEGNGYVSMEADHYSRAVSKGKTHWITIPNLGRTGSAVMPVPVDESPVKPGGDSPCLEYTVYLFSTGKVRVHAFLSPTLDYYNQGGFKYGISFDDDPVSVVNMHEKTDLKTWENWVSNNINIKVSEHEIPEPGRHTLRYWMIDPGVVLQKLVIESESLGKSYLGPPESLYLMHEDHLPEEGL